MSYVNSSVGYRRRSKRSRVRKRRVFAVAALFAVIVASALIAHARSGARTRASDVVSDARSAHFSGEQARNNTSTIRAGGVRFAWSNGERNALRRALHGAFAQALAGANGWSFAVVDAGARTIYHDRADRAVAPASVQKLVVAATALDVLGPAYRYQTLFAGRGGVGENGTLDGDLWLVGSGDPSLTSDDLRNGVGTLARSGLRRIDGGVAVDDTTLSGPGLNPHWGSDDNGQDYAAPTSAISLDGDTVETTQDVGGVEQRFWTPMRDVARYVAGRLNGMFVARGIPLAMPPTIAAAPLDSVVLWDHRSAPLRTLESHMLFVSDNHYAEQLLRTVGDRAAGNGDDTAGIAAERRFLERRGIPAPGLHLYDGSGLSPSNRIAATTVARLLADREPELYDLLPLGGRQGTLEDYDFTTALGRVRAKSGHLSNVSALAGYVTTHRHGRVAFAFLIDGSPGDPDTAIVEAVDRVAAF